MIFHKLSLFLAFLAGASAASLRVKEQPVLEDHLMLFREWSSTHGRDYSSEAVTAERLAVWLENHGKF